VLDFRGTTLSEIFAVNTRIEGLTQLLKARESELERERELTAMLRQQVGDKTEVTNGLDSLCSISNEVLRALNGAGTSIEDTIRSSSAGNQKR
jgi:hypothetical protein